MRKFVKLFTLVVLVWSILYGLFVYLWRPFSPKNTPLMVAQATGPDGIELCVTQIYRGVANLYDISLFSRRKGDPHWNWYYLNHETFYWPGARIEFDVEARTAVLYRGMTKFAQFNCQDDTLVYVEMDRPATKPQGIVRGPILNPALEIIPVSRVERNE